jgi:hypothetical protein
VSNGDVYGSAGCLSRSAYALVLTLFALNRAYLINDKTALAEIDGFERAPSEFGRRLNALLSSIGDEPSRLQRSADALTALFRETRDLAGDLYTPTWRL